MKKLVLLITVFSVFISLQMFAQVESTTVKSSKSNSSEAEKAKDPGDKGKDKNRMAGYPPHGYPCLGCAPCVPATNPVEYCDINNTAALKPHPEALRLGFVFTGGKMIPLATILMKPDVAQKMAALGSVAKTVGNARQQKVKCACGTDIYGKDDAACGRICDFLKDYK